MGRVDPVDPIGICGLKWAVRAVMMRVKTECSSIVGRLRQFMAMKLDAKDYERFEIKKLKNQPSGVG